MTTSAKLMTADDLLHMPDDGRRYELIRGELIELAPPGPKHGYVAGRTYKALDDFVHPRRLGAIITESGFIIASDPDTVRAPDAAFISAEMLPEGGLPDQYMRMAPDIAVEVVSPSDREREVRDKALGWLAAGSRLVWVLYPATRSVTVYRSETDVSTVDSDQILDGAPVLDGFSVYVAELFE